VTVLIDTPILVDHLRGDARAVGLMRSLLAEGGQVWAATPTRTEILAGIGHAEREPMMRLFGLLAWVDIDATVADAAGELAQRYRRSHSGIDTTDYLIAAATQSIGARLLPLNVRHFPMFDGLEPAYA